MRDVKEVVLGCYENLVKEKGVDITPDLEVRIRRENGLDSLGIVNFIVEIEEELDASLDSVLKEIRKVKTLGELVTLIEKAISE